MVVSSHLNRERMTSKVKAEGPLKGPIYYRGETGETSVGCGGGELSYVVSRSVLKCARWCRIH